MYAMRLINQTSPKQLMRTEKQAPSGFLEHLFSHSNPSHLEVSTVLSLYIQTREEAFTSLALCSSYPRLINSYYVILALIFQIPYLRKFIRNKQSLTVLLALKTDWTQILAFLLPICPSCWFSLDYWSWRLNEHQHTLFHLAVCT